MQYNSAGSKYVLRGLEKDFIFYKEGNRFIDRGRTGSDVSIFCSP